MLRAFSLWLRVTPPAIWGRLPAHADFVRHAVRHGESAAWGRWMVQHGLAAADSSDPRAEVPAAFILPPGALALAPRQFVIGVIIPSGDRAGRRHPLLVYQRVSRSWLRAQLNASGTVVPSWLFWLARAIARHAALHAHEGLPTLVRTVQALWTLHASWPQPHWKKNARAAEASASDLDAASLSLLHDLCGPDAPDDPAVLMPGVSALPWTDWPERIFGDRPQSAFWQQNAQGAFMNTATGPAALWQVLPPWPIAGAPSGMDEESSSSQAEVETHEAVTFNLRDLAPMAHDGPNDPFALIGLSRAPARSTAQALANRLGKQNSTAAAASADAFRDRFTPEEITEDSETETADLPPINASSRVLEDLREEFLRVVRDPRLLAGRESADAPVDAAVEVAPTLEQLKQESRRFAMALDIIKPRSSIDQLIESFNVGGKPALTAQVPPPDILHLFAPEFPPPRRSELPSLTLREHHALSPDSHMPVTRQPDPTAPPT